MFWKTILPPLPPVKNITLTSNEFNDGESSLAVAYSNCLFYVLHIFDSLLCLNKILFLIDPVINACLTLAQPSYILMYAIDPLNAYI